ncbi:MAG: HD domain-containing protein, partial [Candidatus Spechtbacterales bacterium]
ESEYAHQGIELMRQTELLEEVLPEVAGGIGVGQNKHHIYDVYEHNLYSLKWADEQKYPLQVKIAALFHDVAKPQAKRGEGPTSTFYGHEVASARVARKICERLRFPKKLGEEVALLVRSHMFYYDIGEVTEKSVRRLVAKVGPERMDDLVKLRICDRMGSGVPKPEPYRLRHFQFMVEKVQKDPITVGMLKVNGADIMEALTVKPGPRVGHILAALFEEVLDDPAKNTKEYLLKRSGELNQMGEEELMAMRKEAQERERVVNEAEAGKIKKKYYVE